MGPRDASASKKQYFDLGKKKYTPDSTGACKEIERIENQESKLFSRVWMGKTVKIDKRESDDPPSLYIVLLTNIQKSVKIKKQILVLVLDREESYDK